VTGIGRASTRSAGRPGPGPPPLGAIEQLLGRRKRGRAGGGASRTGPGCPAGFRPAQHLAELDDPSRAVEAILRANSRTPDLVVGDLRGQVGCNRVGERRLLR